MLAYGYLSSLSPCKEVQGFQLFCSTVDKNSVPLVFSKP